MVASSEAFPVEGEDGAEDAAEGDVLEGGLLGGEVRGGGGSGSAGGNDGHGLIDVVLGYCARLGWLLGLLCLVLVGKRRVSLRVCEV